MYPSSLFKRKRKKSQTPPYQRRPESFFQTPTPLLFQNFWIRIRVRKVYKFENPTPFQIRANIDPTEIYPCFYSRNDHADACYCRNWKLTPDLGPVFHKIKTLGPDPVAKAKRRILPESTPAIRIHGRLYFVLAGDFAGNYDENTLLLFDRKNALRCSFITHISSESLQT